MEDTNTQISYTKLCMCAVPDVEARMSLIVRTTRALLKCEVDDCQEITSSEFIRKSDGGVLLQLDPASRFGVYFKTKIDPKSALTTMMWLVLNAPVRILIKDTDGTIYNAEDGNMIKDRRVQTVCFEHGGISSTLAFMFGREHWTAGWGATRYSMCTFPKEEDCDLQAFAPYGAYNNTWAVNLPDKHGIKCVLAIVEATRGAIRWKHQDHYHIVSTLEENIHHVITDIAGNCLDTNIVSCYPPWELVHLHVHSPSPEMDQSTMN